MNHKINALLNAIQERLRNKDLSQLEKDLLLDDIKKLYKKVYAISIEVPTDRVVENDTAPIESTISKKSMKKLSAEELPVTNNIIIEKEATESVVVKPERKVLPSFNLGINDRFLFAKEFFNDDHNALDDFLLHMTHKNRNEGLTYFNECISEEDQKEERSQIREAFMKILKLS